MLAVILGKLTEADQLTVAQGIADTQTEAVTHAGKHSQSIRQEEASAKLVHSLLLK